MEGKTTAGKARVIIGLGSNLGDRKANLLSACRRISEHVGTIERSSSVLETVAWGFEAPPFLNQVIVLHTHLTPLHLLDVLQSIEREMGRTTKTTLVDGKPIYSSRIIDLDILDYDGIEYHDERLILPHPQIRTREFVKEELLELGFDDMVNKNNQI